MFAGKRGTSLKALWWDKSGYCILYKRLSRGMFRIPVAEEHAKCVTVDARELAVILEGIDLPPRKQQLRAAAKEARKKVLRAIESVTTHTDA